MFKTVSRRARWAAWFVGSTLALITPAVRAQTPADLGKIVDQLGKANNSSPKDDTKAAEPGKATDAEVTPSTAPIDVTNRVDEHQVAQFLNETLAKYPGVQSIEADVHGNVVTLNGRVRDEAVAERLREVALKVEGVVFVINRLRTDAQSLSAFDLFWRQLDEYARIIQQRWLLFAFALGLVVAAIGTARFLNEHSETYLAWLVRNPLLRSVVGSVLALAVILLGTLLALQMLGVVEVVLSVLGLAGVAALAIGFAFRDIAENFIASILLGLRRPFRVGDFIKVSGQAGVVRSLNTRATVLMTLEGHMVRIPNAIMFKEILVNTTASPQVRSTFDLFIAHDASIAQTQDVLAEALAKHDGLARDPAPRALVEEIAREGVRLRVYYWVPTKGVDGYKLNSDARLLARVALQQACIPLAADPNTLRLDAPEPIAIRVQSATGADAAPAGAPSPAPQAPAMASSKPGDDPLRDKRAAVLAAADRADAEDSMQQVLELGDERAAQEGDNLLNNRRDRSAAQSNGH